MSETEKQGASLLTINVSELEKSQHYGTFAINIHNGVRQSEFVGSDFDCRFKSRRGNTAWRHNWKGGR